jgi:hypothetical protein
MLYAASGEELNPKLIKILENWIRLLPFTVNEYGPPWKGVFKNIFQDPSFPVTTDFWFPQLPETSTFSPGSAHPHIGAPISCWSIMLSPKIFGMETSA